MVRFSRMTRGLVTGLLVGLTGLGAWAADWPQFRGPDGSGVAAAGKPPTSWSESENIVWKTELPGAGTSSPVIVGGKAYLTCYSGYGVPGRPRGDMADLKRHLVCLDAKDGRILWDTPTPAVLPEQPTIRDDHGYASSTPAVDGERIYVFYGKSGVFAFDLNGKQLWRADVGSNLNGWGSAASPVLHGDLVIVNASVESESLVALNRTTGKEVWRAGGIKESWATPLLVSVAGRTELVVPILGKILAFDPATGKPLWNCATDISWYMVPCPVAHDGVVYVIGGRSGGALAVRAGGSGDVTSSHRIWTGKKGSNVSSPVYHGGHLYWMNDNQEIAYCAEAKSGRIVYEEKVGRAGQIYSAALLANGNLYYVGRSGRTQVVAAKPSFELVATNELGQRTTFNASPAAVGDRLYLRSDRHAYCLGTK